MGIPITSCSSFNFITKCQFSQTTVGESKEYGLQKLSTGKSTKELHPSEYIEVDFADAMIQGTARPRKSGQ